MNNNGKTVSYRLKPIFLLLWVLIAIVAIVTIKWIGPMWWSFHIAIVVVSVLILITAAWELWDRTSGKRILLIVTLSLVPLIMGFVADRNISQVVCFLSSGSFEDLRNAPINQDVTVCGYLDDCSSAYFGPHEHVWEVCRIIDTVNSQHSILFYVYDITINLDNQFDWSSLRVYDNGTLMIMTGKMVGLINRENCVVDMFCNAGTLPIATIVRYLHFDVEVDRKSVLR